MKKNSRLCLALISAIALAGCAGTNFKRPEPDTLVIGKSTSSDVTRVMGSPLQTGELMKNNEKIKITRYAYAEGAGKGRYPGVTPARSMVFSIFSDRLVGQEFVSSFPDDATDFEETKVSEIKKGKTTRAEVISLLGKPNGEASYPLVKNSTDKGMVYSYTHVTGTVFNMKLYSKALIVSLDSNNVVTDVDYTSTGEK